MISSTPNVLGERAELGGGGRRGAGDGPCRRTDRHVLGLRVQLGSPARPRRGRGRSAAGPCGAWRSCGGSAASARLPLLGLRDRRVDGQERDRLRCQLAGPEIRAIHLPAPRRCPARRSGARTRTAALSRRRGAPSTSTTEQPHPRLGRRRRRRLEDVVLPRNGDTYAVALITPRHRRGIAGSSRCPCHHGPPRHAMPSR